MEVTKGSHHISLYLLSVVTFLYFTVLSFKLGNDLPTNILTLNVCHIIMQSKTDHVHMVPARGVLITSFLWHCSETPIQPKIYPV